jgi:hypothetical protein
VRSEFNAFVVPEARNVLVLAEPTTNGLSGVRFIDSIKYANVVVAQAWFEFIPVLLKGLYQLDLFSLAKERVVLVQPIDNGQSDEMIDRLFYAKTKHASASERLA